MSSPAAPRIRLGPRFAAVNDVDRDVEEALGLEPEVLPEPRFEVEEAEPATSTMEEMEVDTKVGVDEEIDELLSETEEPVVKENSGGWKCRWDDCWKDQDSQEILVEHLQTEHIGQGRETYVCKWDLCPRKGQKQATRHSLITHCRAHTGERPYTCQEYECGKTFTRSDALTKHLRSLHNITPEIPPRKKGKDAAGQALPMTTMPLGSPPTSPLLVTRPKSKEAGIDDAIADILPDSPPPNINPDQAVPSAAAPPPTTAPAKAPSKAKPRRSRAKTEKGKMAAAQASSSTSANVEAAHTRFREVASHIPPTSPFYDPCMGELNNDEDLSSVLPRLFGRQTFWNDSDDDEPALDLIRDVRSRGRQIPQEAEDEYDSLDEMIPPIGPVRVIGETSHPDDPEVVVPVTSRSRYQARFMMAKAKVMLLAEENEMRRKELESTMNEEVELDKQLSKRDRQNLK